MACHRRHHHHHLRAYMNTTIIIFHHHKPTPPLLPGFGLNVQIISTAEWLEREREKLVYLILQLSWRKVFLARRKIDGVPIASSSSSSSSGFFSAP